MASSEQVTVEQASPQDVSETTPLVKRKKSTKSNSLLIKSKAVALILFWTALMSFVYGAAFNPELYFILNLFNRQIASIAYMLCLLSGFCSIL